MNASDAIELARQSIVLMLVIGAPVLIVGMVVGVVISILQAVTQVQEQTLSFVPKIIVMLAVAALTAPWAGARLLEFSRRMFMELP
jgi:flagellar biosynthetic protein FliQ